MATKSPSRNCAHPGCTRRSPVVTLDAPPVGHRLHGVHQQVHERLLDLVLVGRDQERIVAELGRDRDPARRATTSRACRRCGRHWAALMSPSAGRDGGEVEELADHGGL
jgi:hypothetical protein